MIDNRAKSPSKGQEIATPVTVVECPPLKISSARFYKNTSYGLKLVKELPFKAEKELKRRLPQAKNTKEAELDSIKPEEYDDIRVNVYTQPKLTGFKKTPELFEMGLGGNNAEKLAYIKNNLGKDIAISQIFKPGQLVDTIAVTRGKGYQGPVKRFGVAIRHHKSEKTKRGPGSLGGWISQAHFMYRVAHAGQMGYHNRTEYNKWILKISDKVEEVNPRGGFKHYGLVRNPYLLLKGSVQGAAKRLIRFNVPKRPNMLVPKDAPSIVHTSLESKQ
jgi:large subunit ribosomal protein L3